MPSRTLLSCVALFALVPVAHADDHWAFAPVKRPPVPVAAGRTAIDRFVVAKLADKGLSLSPAADRRTLFRRLSFDLIGLPPTPDDVDAFVRDPDPAAYEKLVEKLLASPHYGERWARHWLDVVRYADSHGFEMNNPRPTAYHYRDYVIRALNADVPFDRFVREQLAGDALGADAATGFLVAGPWDQVKSPDPVLTANQRADELHDLIGTAGSAFLGLTVACARCHDHKFDPIPAEDYYRVKAVFAGVQHGERAVKLPGAADPKADTDRLTAQVAELDAKLAALEPLADPAAVKPRRMPVSPLLNTERFAPVAARYVRFVAFETNQGEPCLDELEAFTAGPTPVNVARGGKLRSSGDYPGGTLHKLEHLTDGRYGNGRSWISSTPRGWVEVEFADVAKIDRVVWARDREGKFADRLPTRYRIDVSADRAAWVVVASSDDRLPVGDKSTAPPALAAAQLLEWANLSRQRDDVRKRLADAARGMVAYAGRFTTPEAVHLLGRGDVTQKRDAVGPGALTEIGAPLDIPDAATDVERRKAFAAWVTDPKHPLTARVVVNRLWHWHFGTGLVDTPSDFGKNGGRPSHPELLDWLAAELVEHGWSLKHVHRLIVTSDTYRQASANRPDAAAKDAQSRLLWRYPPRRLEAEVLRDAVLAVSGKLDRTMYGPGFDLFEPNTNYVRVYTPKTTFGPAEFRRMVYQHRPRMQPDDTFGAFDCPDGGQVAPRRNVSITPLQALNLLNSPFVVQQAGFFAARVEKDADPVASAFRLAFQRAPRADELAAARELVAKHGLPALCRALLNANEFVFVD
ncbi:DUF1549 and DUF1553 domain-containing protein [Urbifossiella limnaea]|uniref:F5/8 type C domain protein n=1 Tax=Urbifossiella limnaea TaxID=2528023 RepID=A0A517XR33_9BACT|nr:DUF1549 and DUF1553 domain-containing protein [Urbifossiella limnaea]QDU19961.1 F5/8 type C domain protein [Urbifossiella limnaea]